MGANNNCHQLILRLPIPPQHKFSRGRLSHVVQTTSFALTSIFLLTVGRNVDLVREIPLKPSHKRNHVTDFQERETANNLLLHPAPECRRFCSVGSQYWALFFRSLHAQIL